MTEPKKRSGKPKADKPPKKAALAVVKKPMGRPARYTFDPALGPTKSHPVTLPVTFFDLWFGVPGIFRARVEKVIKESLDLLK